MRITEKHKIIFWDFVEELDWNNGCDHMASNKILRSKTEKEQRILTRVFNHYMKELSSKFTHFRCGDLNWKFLSSGIIASGEKHYNEMNQDTIDYLIEIEDYIESFSYTFLEL